MTPKPASNETVIPDWINLAMSSELGFCLVDPSGTILESHGEPARWLFTGANIFTDVAVFVGLREVFDELAQEPGGEFRIDDFTLAAVRSPTTYSLRVNWFADRRQFSIIVSQNNRRSDLHDTVLRNARKAQYLEACIAQERQRFEDIYRSTPSLAAAFTADGQLTAITDRFQSLLLYEPAALTPARSQSLTGALQPLLNSTIWRRAWNEPAVEDVPLSMPVAGGAVRDLELSSILVGESGTRPAQCYFVATDVTERNRLLHALRAKAGELDASNKDLLRLNAELERFATVASHDLQEPLRHILLFSDMLGDAVSKSEHDNIAYALDVIQKSARRSRQLVEDILALARLSSCELALQNIEIAPLVNGLVNDLRRLHGHDAAKLMVDFGPTTVKSDPVLLRQILSNLLGNAFKYRAPSRPLLISIRSRAGDGAGIEIDVEDNGTGFDPARSDVVFEPFVRLSTDAAVRGSGVGLAIVKRAVERLGGSVSVTTVPGEGSRFKLLLNQ